MASFWSLILEPGKRYQKSVEHGIQVTRATLDTAKATATTEGLVQVVLRHNSQNLTVANLSMKHGIFQTQLDLLFQGGEEIEFTSSGARIPVILTGSAGIDDDDSDDEDDADYLLEDPTLDSTGLTMDDSDEEPALIPAGTKRKLGSSGKQPAKHAKLSNGVTKELTLNGQSFMSEDDSDDDSYNPVPDLEDDQSQLPEDTLEDEDMEGTVLDEEDDDDDDEEDDDDDEEDDEEEGDEDDDEEEELEEEEVAPVKEHTKKSKKEMKAAAASTPKQKEAPKTPKDGKTKKEVKTPKSESVKAPKTESGKSPKAEKKEKTPLKTNNKENIDKTPKHEKKKSLEGKKESAQKASKQTRSGGVVVEDVLAGSGAEAKLGQAVSVYYNGTLKSNNKCFDKTLSGPPFKFRLGAGEVIKGWDIGVAGMKIGGKRKISVPPTMGYGKSGAPPQIPPHAFLNFEVTLVNIK